MGDINSQKLKVVRWITNEEEPGAISKILEVIADVEYERASDTMVIGYRINGLRVIKSRFLHLIQLAEIGLETGEYITMDELEKSAETW